MELEKAKTIGKGKEKRKSENFHLRKKLDTIEDPQNNHTIGEQVCGLMDYHLENCLGAMF